MTKTNFHTHTYRCGHARGSEEEMVKRAIDQGISILGFSDHIPLPHYRTHLFKALPHTLSSPHAFLSCCKTILTNGPSMRMPYSSRKEHQESVMTLKNKYHDHITIYQGYEAEYFPEYLDYYQSLLDHQEIDYLILGQHFHQYSIHNRYYGGIHITDDMIIQYKEDVMRAIKSHLFSYIAHPDLFMVGKIEFDDLCQNVAYEICQCAKEHHIPLEINAGGMRKGRRKVQDEMLYPYPNDHFFEIASRVGNEVVFGIDAHQPEDLNDQIYDELNRFAQKLNLNVIETFEMRKGK